MNGRRARLAALAGVDMAIVIYLRSDAFGLLRRLPRVTAKLRSDPDSTIAAFGAAMLWLIALWLGIGLLVTVAGEGRGAPAAAARRLSRWLLPATARRLVVAAIGTGVVLTPVPATASPINPTTAVAAAGSLPSPTWPVEPRPVDAAAPAAHRSPAPAWPSDHGATPREAPTDAPAQAEPSRVVVRPGDSLWSRAAHALGADTTTEDIAQEWPRWYRANRRVIGSDPSLIRPGEVLLAPAPERQSQ